MLEVVLEAVLEVVLEAVLEVVLTCSIVLAFSMVPLPTRTTPSLSRPPASPVAAKSPRLQVAVRVGA